MTSYLRTLHLSWFPGPIRRTIANEVVPALLNKLGAEGIQVHCGHDLSVIRQVQLQSPEKPRLFELASPEHYPQTSLADTFVLHLTKIETGQDVACAAVRLRWAERSIAEALESKTLILDRPSESLGEFKVRNEWARRTCDVHLAITTGVCVLPGHRGVFKTMMRLLHLWPLSEWRFTYYFALAPDKIASRYSLDVEGYSAVHPGLLWKREGIWTPYRLVVAEREHWRQLITSPSFSDLSAPLGAPETGE